MNARVSLIIPVYNESDCIHDCLVAVAAQTVRPFEVIVIDNNSSDGTAALAAAFDFVTVLHEPRQGVVYARDRGFDAASGDIIGRIDADSIIVTDWIEQLQIIFDDPSVDLTTGSVHVRGIACAGLASRIDLFWRRYLYKRLGHKVALQGANMALRASVWKAVHSQLCHTKGLHEDYDLGLHSYAKGMRATLDERLNASVRHRQLDNGFGRFANYALTSPRSYLSHGERLGLHMYVVVGFVFALYPLIVVLSRGYDDSLGRFSLRTLCSTPSLRVNPATFLD